VTFIVINAALIVLRYQKPQIDRPFAVPFSLGRLPLLPVIGIFFNAFLLAQLEWKVMSIGLALIGIGGIAALFCRQIRPSHF
jgi:APA family basic amino acid/polyamine antiporter